MRGGDVLVYLGDVSWSRGLGMLTWYSVGMGMNRLRGDSVGEDMAVGGRAESQREGKEMSNGKKRFYLAVAPGGGHVAPVNCRISD